MVVNSSEPESGGGKEGFLVVVAIAVVLFFVVKIYSDYVTATGQAVKPGSKRKVTAYAPPSTELDSEDPLDQPVRPRAIYPRTSRPRSKPEPPAVDETPDDESPDQSPVEPAPLRGGETFAKSVPAGDAKSRFRGQIVVERSEDGTFTSPGPRAGKRRQSPLVPPRPRITDEPSPPDGTDSGDSVRAASTRPTLESLFQEGTPYPGVYDDIQVGDRLSDIRALKLPGARLSHSLYSYQPPGGPFKSIYAMLASGPADPPVTGVVYLFRSAKYRADIRRQAIQAFGEGEAALTDEGERREWAHVGGNTVSLERDRYSVEVDTSASGRRFHRSTSSGRQR